MVERNHVTCVDGPDGLVAVSPSGAPRVIPYYRSNGQILEFFLICREQSRHSFAVILSPRGATGQVSTVLIGREPSRDL